MTLIVTAFPNRFSALSKRRKQMPIDAWTHKCLTRCPMQRGHVLAGSTMPNRYRTLATTF